MKLIYRRDNTLLGNSWAWVTDDDIELDPLFSTAEKALEWAKKNLGIKNGKRNCGRKTATEGKAQAEAQCD